MSIVTFASGVHVGARDDAQPFIDWFATTPTTQFSTFSLALASAQVLTAVEGRAGDREQLLLRFQGRGMATGYDSLKAISARGPLGDRPLVGLSGFLDWMAREAYLTQITLRLVGDISRTEWGVLSNVRNSVGPGSAWSVQAVFNPCDALGWVGTTNWFLTPTVYADLAGA